MINVIIEICEKETGGCIYLIKPANNDNNFYEWREGNYSCDCNRAILYSGNWDVQCGNELYSVTIFDAFNGNVLYEG